MQSAQERELIKTAPDMVVYIDGLPYVLNPFLSPEVKDLVAVNFNDYITTISTNYSIDSMIPTGTIGLSIPNGFKHLFMAPGGELVIETMMSVRIYAKCYFFSPSGNTVFRRIFNGVIRSISINETPTGMEVSLSIAGIMRLLEILQIETKPSVAGAAPEEATVGKTTQYKMDIYTAIYDTLEQPLNFKEYLKSSILQQNVNETQYADVIKQEYVERWSKKLQDLRKDVRIFGGRTKSLDKQQVQGTPRDADKTEDPAKSGTSQPPVKGEIATSLENSPFIDNVRKYTFDFMVSGIPLLGGSLVPRLERVRQLSDMAGLECYQDVDGLFIVKPPLYNLDCTILGSVFSGNKSITDKEGKQRTVDTLADENLYEGANPYILHMAEILSEQYTEDESGVRATSMVISPNFANSNTLQLEGKIDLSKCVRYVDINLLRQFGVREAPAKYAGFLSSDNLSTMAYAICELNRTNRAFRTYNATIPLRPELRLGFPVYIPHKDMYAYVVQINNTYTVGGAATTSLSCNYIRKRPLVPRKQTFSSDPTTTTEDLSRATNDEINTEAMVYTTQPNLVMYWKPASAPPPPLSLAASPASKTGLAASQNTLPSEAPSASQTAVIIFKRYKFSSLFETKTDTIGNWVIRKDDNQKKVQVNVESGSVEKTGPFFDGKYDVKTGKKTNPIKSDGAYLQICTTVQPYTDEKGYEVISCIPWGRYSTLRSALTDCTRNYWDTDKESQNKEEEIEKIKTSNTFLMAGLTTPGWTNASAVLQSLKNTSSKLQGAEDYYIDIAGVADASVAAYAARSEQIKTTTEEFEQFEKSNVVSFELDYSGSMFGQTEAAFPTEDKTPYGNMTDMGRINPQLGMDGNSSKNVVDAVNIFLNGFMQAQNTDIGGYSYFNGPFSGVIGSIRAQFEMGPWSALFDMGRSGSPYFTSGNESRGNRTW